MPFLAELSVKRTDRVLKGSARLLQEQGDQSWLAREKGTSPRRAGPECRGSF